MPGELEHRSIVILSASEESRPLAYAILHSCTEEHIMTLPKNHSHPKDGEYPRPSSI